MFSYELLYGVPILSKLSVCGRQVDRQTSIAKITHFCWYSVFDSMCGKDRRPFSSQFNANWSTFGDDMCGKRLTFCFQWPWPLTVWPQTFSPVTRIEGYFCSKLEGSTAFWFRVNRMAWDRQTDRRINRQTDGRIRPLEMTHNKLTIAW